LAYEFFSKLCTKPLNAKYYYFALLALSKSKDSLTTQDSKLRYIYLFYLRNKFWKDWLQLVSLYRQIHKFFDDVLLKPSQSHLFQSPLWEKTPYFGCLFIETIWLKFPLVTSHFTVFYFYSNQMPKQSGVKETLYVFKQFDQADGFLMGHSRGKGKKVLLF